MHTFLTLLITDTLDDPYAFPCSRHPYIISSPPPWSLALPHWRFSPTAPGAVLTTLDLCPLNIDLHLRSPDQIKFARVLVSTEDLLTAVPNIWEFESRPLSRSSRVWEQNRGWALTALGDIATNRVWTAIEYSLVDLDSSFRSKVKFFTALSRLWGLRGCTPRIKSRMWLVIHIEDIST